MALPTSVIGTGTLNTFSGPFISSGGNVYFFAVDSGLTKTMDVLKATDPTSSFGVAASQTFSSSAQSSLTAIASYQIGDVIHLTVFGKGGTGNATTGNYLQFDMSSDTFTVSELDPSIFNNLTTPASINDPPVTTCSVVVRSTGEAVIFYNGNTTTSKGSSFSRVYYTRRTAANTYAAAVEVDAGGSTSFVGSEAVLGASDSVHFFWKDLTAAGTYHRTLSSGNALQTASTKNTTVGNPRQAVSFTNSGTKKVALITDNNRVLYFDSANTPTLNASAAISSGTQDPRRLFYDGTDLYAVYGKSADNDLYMEKSTDNGATWS